MLDIILHTNLHGHHRVSLQTKKKKLIKYLIDFLYKLLKFITAQMIKNNGPIISTDLIY